MTCCPGLSRGLLLSLRERDVSALTSSLLFQWFSYNSALHYSRSEMSGWSTDAIYICFLQGRELSGSKVWTGTFSRYSGHTGSDSGSLKLETRMGSPRLELSGRSRFLYTSLLN